MEEKNIDNKNEFGKYLRRLRLLSDFTVEEVGNKVNLTKGYLSRLETGKRGVPPIKTLKLLAEFYNVPLVEMMEKAGYLEDLSSNIINESKEDYKIEMLPIDTDIVYLPILGKISAGIPMLAVENIEGQAPVEKKDLHIGHQYFYLKVSGDSMNMKIQDNDLVLVQCQDTLEDGDIGIVLVNGYDATIKRYKRKGDIVILEPMSYNPQHQAQMYDINEIPIKIIGKAIGGKIIF